MNSPLPLNQSERKSLVRSQRTFQKEKGLHPRLHARDLDKKLGFKINRIEAKLLQKYRSYDEYSNEGGTQHYEGTQTWIGLPPQVLQTPYNDIYEALESLSQYPIERIVDIGCGYGRVGLVMNSLFPNAEFIGYEVLKQRAREANRVYEQLDLENCEVLLENVLDDAFKLPKAQIYFIYDFSEMHDLCVILDELVKRVNDYQFYLITVGERIDYLIERKYKPFWITNGFIKRGALKIYSSLNNIENRNDGNSNKG
ncbi:MAG: hypothetical protein CME63_09050 [Halobacteriovoraceae bacterium]|nr:hypothetical protein [Halobacteriovoraceae bacterium]